jgi:hypothetical protein
MLATLGMEDQNLERKFSPEGLYSLPRENYARDNMHALYLSSILVYHGYPLRRDTN